MSLDQRVNALTASLRSDFYKAWNQVAKPAEWEQVTSVLPSTTKIENWINATPVPSFQLWTGSRNYAQVDTFLYQVRNQTFHDEVSCRLEDIEDDQIGILERQPQFLSEKGKLFPGRMVFKLLGQGLGATPPGTSPVLIGNLNAFDGLPFFSNRTAAANGFGVGNNLISYTGGSGDGLTYNLAALFYGNEYLKPLCWQQRSGPDFRTNAGSPESYENRNIRWWCDLRGAPFFSYYWNCIGVNILNTPTVADMHAIISVIISAFRSFQYPPTSSTEDGEFIHEQTTFNAGNMFLLGSTQLSEQLRQALDSEWIPQNIGTNTVATTNTWKGWSKWGVSHFLNNF